MGTVERLVQVHELVKEPSIYNESYQRVVENYYADMKTQIQEKKREAKENSENNRISDVLEWKVRNCRF